ncbi:MAG: DUF2946 family protein [Pseudomonadota bacterium]
MSGTAQHGSFYTPRKAGETVAPDTRPASADTLESRPMCNPWLPRTLRRHVTWLALWIVLWGSVAPGVAQWVFRTANAWGPGVEICTTTGVVQWRDDASDSAPAGALSPACDWCRLDVHWALPCLGGASAAVPPAPRHWVGARDTGQPLWGRWERPSVRGPPR